MWRQDFGSAIGRELGINQEIIDEVANWKLSDRLTDIEKLVLEYAGAVSVTPRSGGR